MVVVSVELNCYIEASGLVAASQKTGQNEPFCLVCENHPQQRRGFQRFLDPLKLDKAMSDRKHLVSAEMDRLLAATKGSRHEARDRCLLLLMFRHGLRVSEAIGLNLSQVDTESRVLHVERLKQGLNTTHPLRSDEIRAVKSWLAERRKMKPETDDFFISQQRGPLSRKTVWLAIRHYGELADLCPCPPIRTCCATLAASPLRIKARTRG